MSYTISRRSQRKRPVKTDVAPEGMKENNEESLERLMMMKNWEAAIQLLDTREGRREAGRLLDKTTRELPLHAAAATPDVNMEFLKKLVEAYPNGARRRDAHGRTPPMVAVFALQRLEEETEEIQDAVEQVGDILECFLTVSQEAGTILFLTTAYPSIVRRILRICPEAAKTCQSFSADLPLHVVCETDEFLSDQHRDRVVETGKLLYEAYPEAMEAENEQGLRPLSIAAGSFIEMAQYLVNVHPAAAAVPTCDKNYRRLPIHTICQLSGPPIDLIQDFIKAYPEGLEAKELVDGNLPLHCIIAHTHYRWNQDTILMLLNANPNTAGIPANDGSYALHHLCLSPEWVDVDLLRAVVDAFPGALHLPNSHGRLPLHNALLCYNLWDRNPERRVDVLALLLPLHPTALLTPDNEGLLPFDYDGALGMQPFLQHYSEAHGIAVEEEKPTQNEEGGEDGDNDHNNNAEEENSDSDEATDDDGERARNLIEQRLKQAKLAFMKNLIALAYPKRDGLGQADWDGRVPIHIACANNTALPVLDAFQSMYPEALQIPEARTGNLALHLVCATSPLSQNDDESSASEDENFGDEENEGNRNRNDSDHLERIKSMVRWNGAALLERNHKGELPLAVAFLHHACVDVLYVLLRENPQVVISDLLPNAEEMKVTAESLASSPEEFPLETTEKGSATAEEEAAVATTTAKEEATPAAATEKEQKEQATVSTTKATTTPPPRTELAASDEKSTLTTATESTTQEEEASSLLWGSEKKEGTKSCFVF